MYFRFQKTARLRYSLHTNPATVAGLYFVNIQNILWITNMQTFAVKTRLSGLGHSTAAQGLMKPDIDCENLYTNNSIYNRHFPTLRSYTTLTSAYGINTRHPFLKQNSLLPPDSSYRSKSKIIQAMTIAHRLHLSFEPSIFNFSFYLLA